MFLLTSGGAYSAGSPLYSFVIPDQGGYDLNGNLLSATDTVMGEWNYSYDNLNRLVQASAPVSQPTGVNAYYAGVQPTWTYDPFGNRLTETQGKIAGANPSASMPPNTTTTYTGASNQIYTTTLGSGITYDAAGDITYDGSNYYLYDAEGRLCAVNNSGALTGYIYDASGIRVAKGSLTSFSCNFASNGYATTSSYVLGPGGEQVTEYNGAGVWQHTNAFVSGALLASYHDTDTYFALNDWLGTKRAEISAGGLIANYHSLAYGNGLTQSGTAPDATEHHFTGKERDAESGDDYFGARYYASSMGRFMSPDPSQLYYADPTKPQSLNLYNYGLNNPLVNTDPTGLDCVYDGGGGNFHTTTGDCDNSTEALANAGHYIDCDGCTTNSTAGTLDPTTGTLSLTDASGNLIPGTNVSDWADPQGVSTSVMVSAKTYGIAMAGYGIPGGFFSYRPNTIGPIPHTPPPPSAFECAVTPTEAMAYHAAAMQIWRQQNGMNLASSTPSDDDTGGAGGSSMKAYTSRGWRPFGSAGADAKFSAGAAAADYIVSATACGESK